MTKEAAEKIVDYQTEHGILSIGDESSYLYAYEMFLNLIINSMITIILALVFNELISVFVFMMVYIPIRKYGGGYHSRSAQRCTLSSTLLTTLVIGANKIIYWVGTELIWVLAGAIIICIVCVLSPIKTGNNILTEKVKNSCKKKVSVISSIYLTIIIVNYISFHSTYITRNVVYAYGAIVILQMAEYIKDKRKHGAVNN